MSARLRLALGLLAAAAVLVGIGGNQALASTVHCGDTITQNTTLDNDLINCPGDGLIVGANGITIDLNGHTIDGQGSPDVLAPQTGIAASRVSVTIENGVIQEFGTAFSAGKGSVTATNMTFRRNWITREGDHSTATITNSTIVDNHFGIEGEFQGGNVDVSQSVITHNRTGGVQLGGGSLVDDLITDNGGDGVIAAFPGDFVKNSVITGNALDGIHQLDEQVNGFYDNNTVDHNGDDGIDIDGLRDYTEIIGNHTWWNGDLGIEAVPSVTGGSNWAKHNGNPLQCVPASLCSTTGKPKG